MPGRSWHIGRRQGSEKTSTWLAATSAVLRGAPLLQRLGLSQDLRREKVALWVQVNMKKDLREVYLAPNRASAEVAIDACDEHRKIVPRLRLDYAVSYRVRKGGW